MLGSWVRAPNGSRRESLLDSLFLCLWGSHPRVLSPLRFESVSLRRRARAPNGSQKASHYEMLFAFIKDIFSGVIILIIQISFTQTVSLTIRNIVITLLRDNETPVVISRHRATTPPCPQSSPPHGGAGGEAPYFPVSSSTNGLSLKLCLCWSQKPKSAS